MREGGKKKTQTKTITFRVSFCLENVRQINYMYVYVWSIIKKDFIQILNIHQQLDIYIFWIYPINDLIAADKIINQTTV